MHASTHPHTPTHTRLYIYLHKQTYKQTHTHTHTRRCAKEASVPVMMDVGVLTTHTNPTRKQQTRHDLHKTQNGHGFSPHQHTA